jgi:hypothetical protein
MIVLHAFSAAAANIISVTQSPIPQMGWNLGLLLFIKTAPEFRADL